MPSRQKNQMNDRMIYFDCNATTPLIREASQAASAALTEHFANPSSMHWEGCLASKMRDTARARAAAVFEVASEEIIFTSGATESIHTAIFSALFHFVQEKKRNGHFNQSRKKLLYGQTEHKVVPEALAHWVKILDLPFEVIAIPVDAVGQYREDFLRDHIDTCYLICTMAVNNETGVIQNLQRISELVHKEKTHSTQHLERPLWIVDGVQALGKIQLNLKKQGIDYCAFSGHKVYAPKGTGMLYAALNVPFTPLFVGGGQESGRRSGTEALPAMSGLSQVLKLFGSKKSEGPFHDETTLKHYRSLLLDALSSAFQDFELNAPLESCVPTTLNFSVKGYSSSELWVLLEAYGVLVSSGSACQAAKLSPSHVIQAMGCPEWKLASATRLSFGMATVKEEIDQGCVRIRAAGTALSQPFLPCFLRDGKYKSVRISNGFRTGMFFFEEETALCHQIGVSDDLQARFARTLNAVNQARSEKNLPEFKRGSVFYTGSEGLDLTQQNPEAAVSFHPIKCSEMQHSSWKFDAPQPGILVAHRSGLSAKNKVEEKAKGTPCVFFAQSASLQSKAHRAHILADMLADALAHVSQPVAQGQDSCVGIICSQDLEGGGLPFLLEADGSIETINDLMETTDLNCLEPEGITKKICSHKMGHEIRLIDVREYQEHSKLSPFYKVTEDFSRKNVHVESVPLSEFLGFLMTEIEYDPLRAQHFVFFCRSGKRGRSAALLMRLFGWKSAQNIGGGLSCILQSDQEM